MTWRRTFPSALSGLVLLIVTAIGVAGCGSDVITDAARNSASAFLTQVAQGTIDQVFAD